MAKLTVLFLDSVTKAIQKLNPIDQAKIAASVEIHVHQTYQRSDPRTDCAARASAFLSERRHGLFRQYIQKTKRKNAETGDTACGKYIQNNSTKRQKTKLKSTMKKSPANNRIQKTRGLQWNSAKETFRKASKTKVYQRAYKEELLRLTLAKQIRELRQGRNMTQKAMAQKAHMPQSVIARLESGEHSFSLDTLNRVALVFDKKVQLV